MEKPATIEETNQKDLYEQEDALAAQVEKYKMVAVVDAGRSFINNEVRS